jgi:hypothetical protein
VSPYRRPQSPGQILSPSLAPGGGRSDHEFFRFTPEGSAIDIQLIESGNYTVEIFFYQAILQALAPRQIALLRALAVEPSKTILSFLEDGGETERVNRIYNIGVTLGARESISIWKIDFDRVGIDYSWGNAGLRGIGFNMGFPF